jgi:uncharacterized protein YbbK (DUF523 family)
MRLAAGAAGPRLVEIASGRDHTQRLEDFARARLQALAAQQLSGYILKKDSPSCGLTRVEVTRSGSAPERDGRGLFAAELLRVFAELPVEEDDRLEDPALRESFIERVVAYHRLRHFR